MEILATHFNLGDDHTHARFNVTTHGHYCILSISFLAFIALVLDLSNNGLFVPLSLDLSKWNILRALCVLTSLVRFLSLSRLLVYYLIDVLELCRTKCIHYS